MRLLTSLLAAVVLADLAAVMPPESVVVRLSASASRACVQFDTNRMLYLAAWPLPQERTNSTVSPPRRGSLAVAWKNKTVPGWMLASSAESKLPLAFEGMRTLGSNVVFRYRAGDCIIQDLPGLIESKGFPFFTRTLRLSVSTNWLVVRLRDAGCDSLPPGVPCPSVVVLDGIGVQARLNNDHIEAVIPPHAQSITAKFLFVDSEHGQAIPFDHLERITAPDIPLNRD